MKTPVDLEGKTIFVTGSAGFIGANLVKRLLTVPHVRIIGIDNMNDYYDVSLKEYRLKELENLIYDTQGNAHVFTQYFVKTGPNTWQMNTLIDGAHPHAGKSNRTNDRWRTAEYFSGRGADG